MSRGRVWNFLGFVAATYLVWVALSFLVDPFLGLFVAFIVGIPIVIDAASDFWRILWLAMVVASLVSLFAWLYLPRSIGSGFVAAIVANSFFIFVLLISAEVHSITAMRLEASRLDVDCYDRHSFTHSLFAIELEPLGRLMKNHSHGRAVVNGQQALWSYKTMTFEVTDKKFLAPFTCRSDG